MSQPDPADRGGLSIDPGVLRKVVEHSADGVPGTLRVPRKLAGVGIGEQGASARLTLAGQDIDVRLDLALRYPAPVRSTVDAVRVAVSDEVERITGYRVRVVDVTVSALLPETRPRVE
ncbi:Asp23/Gls24 family envelope stress response protein [Crossiella sp. SN42]|uniref:Asp23/Gls24 family envelope stress response protein n=1 Tax=Crossiella sp. SN42 TaxID=2944808 RepID=UPI00207CAB2C|nr:Asp23/Gls24 family envelope stress response protein [Crossiella sp. SN42]MCO1574852.1 Asp23/Gls24 family envelope stress response protein [Crossiella sp. SN42]